MTINMTVAIQLRYVYAPFISTPLLKNISLSISQGTRMALLGDTGSGKSTLAKIIAGIPSELAVDGSIRFSPPLQKVIYINQDPNALPPHSRLSSLWHCINAEQSQDREKEFHEILDFLKLDRLRLNAFPHSLSGGEKQRILLAIGMAIQPNILILDEPTSALDKDSRHRLSLLLQRLSPQQTVIIISHDIIFVEQVCSQALFLKDGNIIDHVCFQKNIQIKALKHEHSKALLSTQKKMV